MKRISYLQRRNEVFFLMFIKKYSSNISDLTVNAFTMVSNRILLLLQSLINLKWSMVVGKVIVRSVSNSRCNP